MFARILLVLLAMGIAPDALPAQRPATPAYWPDLRPGPQSVGFRQRWVVDSGRRLPGGDSLGLRYRPLLMNLWYPAPATTTAPMPYREYFSGAPAAAGNRSGLRRYAAAMVDVVQHLSARELLGGSPDSAPAADRARYQALLGTATLAQRDAPMAPGITRVAIYLQGSQSSWDDNVILCEWLASHGWLVIGSAFPAEDNSTFETVASDHSRERDVRRLAVEAGRLLDGRPIWIAVIGHSAGAQAMFLLAADPSAPIDALLSLDTTQDYAMLSDHTWAYYTDRVIERREAIALPIAFVADPGALFELADSLGASRRWLVTVPGVRHNEFIGQGVIRDVVIGERDSVVANRYAALVRFVGRWLNAVSRGEPTIVTAEPPLEVVEVPPGERFPALEGDSVATARGLRHLLARGRDTAFVREALRLRANGSPAAGDAPLMMLLAHVVTVGQAERAGGLFHALERGDPTVDAVFDAVSRRAAIFSQVGARDLAEQWQAIRDALERARREAGS